MAESTPFDALHHQLCAHEDAAIFDLAADANGHFVLNEISNAIAMVEAQQERWRRAAVHHTQFSAMKRQSAWDEADTIITSDDRTMRATIEPCDNCDCQLSEKPEHADNIGCHKLVVDKSPGDKS